jgi:hypothetical protein
MTLPDAYGDEAEELAPPPDAVSKRSRGVALGLCFFGGIFGLHRFYVNKTKTAIGMICTGGGLGIWWLYDLVLLAAGEFRDAQDLPLRNWGVEESPGAVRRISSRAERRVEELEDQMAGLRDQVTELAERVDFAERMLAQQREPPRFPPASRG